MNGPVPAGYYTAPGDPAGSVRYWDGTRWHDEVYQAAEPPAAASGPAEYFASVGVRIGAGAIDAAIAVSISLVVFVTQVTSIRDFTDAPAVSPPMLLTGAALWMARVAMVALLGGTPGKLMLGLRVTLEDGQSTPPGWSAAIVRDLPSLIGWIPVLGSLASTGLLVLNIVFLADDPERRAIHDRIGGTRVVHAKQIQR